eukprot:SAG22_NODE_5536_length_997_cov_1.513363_2_plen_132_part_00
MTLHPYRELIIEERGLQHTDSSTILLTRYGAKRATVELPLASPYQFRVMEDQLLGYVWPKWCRGGEAGEFRVHCAEPYKLSLWRYGAEKVHVAKIGWFDEHGPRATVQITPDDDYTQSGVQWGGRTMRTQL